MSNWLRKWCGLAFVLGVVVFAFATPVDAAKKCYDCHKKEKELFQSRKLVHKPTADENCEACHKRHGFAQQLILKDNTANLCFDCHSDIEATLKTDNVHFPLEAGVCWDCHDPHSSDKSALLRTGPEGADDPGACLICHKSDLDTVLTADHGHQPFVELQCQLCHKPHASAHDGLLIDTPQNLCASCHELTEDKFVTAHMDKHITGLSCIDCHTGHGSQSAGLLSDKTHLPFAEGDCETCHSLPDTDGQVAFDPNMSIGELCASCHDEIYEQIDLAHGHDAVDADNCMDCHQPHSSRHGNLLKAPQNELCMECHDGVLTSSGLTPHLPVVLGDCTSCHSVHGSENSGLVKKTGIELCTACHSDFADARDSATAVHAAADDCLECHRPHEGLGPAMLAKEPTDLCGSCHADDVSARSGHQPFLSANCLGCHNPHHTERPHLVRTEGPELCLSCHADIGSRLAMPSAHEAATDDCLACHSPHTSDNLHLLTNTEKELCLACHDPEDIQLDQSVVHTPAADGDCSGCHNPHGSVLDNLIAGRTTTRIIDGLVVSRVPHLTDRSADLCYTCHEDLAEQFRVQGVHAPVAAGDCDACHESHGSAHASFTRAGAPDLCADCHTIDPELTAAHSGYALDSVNCLGCHNPHVSDMPKLVRGSLHPPFEEGDCEICHSADADGRPVLEEPMSNLCGACHDSIEEVASWAHQHGPFTDGDCTACHNVHAADHPNLLRASKEDLCTGCHSSVHDQLARDQVHQPLAEGKCLDCHQPHASKFDGLLTAAAGTFCFECHGNLKAQIADGTPHPPVADHQCLACHEPHAGDHASLLVDSRAELCTACHDLGTAASLAAHSQFDLAEADCQSCHQAHVADKSVSGLLHPEIHAPFESGDCTVCHSANRGDALNDSPQALCLECHDDMQEALTKPVVHAPLAEDDGCVACHGPHVGHGSGLLTKRGVETCLTCHSGQEFSGTNRHEVAFDDCGTCHQPHSSEHAGLLETNDINQLCLDCHDDATESHYHPMGDEVLDPRTGAGINCVSCHSPHTSNFGNLLIADKNRKLCIFCHDLAH